jgi:hypothetical protein
VHACAVSNSGLSSAALPRTHADLRPVRGAPSAGEIALARSDVDVEQGGWGGGGDVDNTDWDAVGRTNLRGRVGTPETSPGSTIFLASRASAFTVGEIITCDGGILARGADVPKGPAQRAPTAVTGLQSAAGARGPWCGLSG